MDKKTKNVFFDIEMLRRRLIRPYFIELGLTVGQGQSWRMLALWM